MVLQAAESVMKAYADGLSRQSVQLMLGRSDGRWGQFDHCRGSQRRRVLHGSPHLDVFRLNGKLVQWNCG